MTQAETRAAIVAEALSWIGTKYHHGAALKGVGCDCARLPASVYGSLCLIPDLKPHYTPDWMLHRDEEAFLGYVTPYAREIEASELQPGDLVIWKFGRTYSHSAIVIDPPTVVHAVIKGGAVILADMDQDVELKDRPRRYFSLFEHPLSSNNVPGAE